MKDEAIKISSNRQKKMDIGTELSEKFGKANSIVFTNYQGITHKQLEGFKRAIKPLKAEYVVAKNSLLTIALTENKLKLEEGQELDGQTGTLFLYDDVISPLKALAKTIKELNLPSVKFGIMEQKPLTGEQVLKLSTLPSREVLLAQLVGGLKSPIFGLHRALNWNLQKLVMTLNAVVGVKPALATVAAATGVATSIQSSAVAPTEPAESTQTTVVETSVTENAAEPEAIQDETVVEMVAELPEKENPSIEAQENKEEVKKESSQETNEEQSPKGNNKKPSAQEASGTEGGEN